MSGYSKRPVWAKLGIREDMCTHFVNAPDNFAAFLATPFDLQTDCSRPFDYVHIFSNTRSELSSLLGKYRIALAQAGLIWVSWYKKASGKPSEITEDSVRELALPLGLVDVKVCAIDADWSALKLVIRKELREAPA